MIIEYFLQKVLLHSQFFDLSIFAIFLHLLKLVLLLFVNSLYLFFRLFLFLHIFIVLLYNNTSSAVMFVQPAESAVS
ncbi:hypothetical protein GLOIN_2v1687537 [Rhizophagus irregularis DAOM 181602=DAOM 197198]|uniref:Uncharacterized protein n=1 Tax=Rhizophagus irregularis (strain DAOM 181602 / DAOM 197198 / MUCL 43194) TaxID=747089 RepID=A0A2P4PD95_RHIID|nr:hypothetical protein GLOIN_2v1687537 [Rhizophagus irregularis DAOM 181602=DAOM 197198]POG63352.1 hypothetical protein GLOIN_2v1687537 [Rhizophagus irregularis DAOM 181602=DAOM 197198]GET63986.1 hypothetical protein GLOIN_2v1687537 [Rhizophagus irregularis DAOM 181602=DAOM 197198]|eukprot:XP_025170218.1 hypothetical protein GLOIN_2v1687537 [Rhizophagus irregularis DAOM 181602=DAOM 197198]